MASSSDSLNLIMPAGWTDLSQAQLKFVFSLLCLRIPPDEAKMLALMRLARVKVVCRHGADRYLIQVGKREAAVRPAQFAELLSLLDWLVDIPPFPVRLEVIRRHKARPADFSEVPFGVFLICENLYQGFLRLKDFNLVDQMAFHLYPGLRASLKDFERASVIYWFAALKGFFARRFPDFFVPADVSAPADNLLEPRFASADALQQNVDAMIRALTKGDVSKEALILDLDCIRALTELNAQARDFAALKAASKS